jgi:VWFA-related protein
MTAHAQSTYEVRSFVRFENAKTRQPLNTAVPSDNLRISDDGKSALKVQVSSAEDVPITVVVAFDTSGSERDSGVVHTLRQSLPGFLQQVVRHGKDSVTLVNFSDEVYFDAGPTDDLRKISEQLKKHEESRGGTALYDSITVICKRSKNGSAQQRRVMLLFSDGQDNASESDLQAAMEVAQDSDTSIFAVSTGEKGATRGNRILQQLAVSTGGRVFDGIQSKQVDDFYRFLVRVLRSQFLITYTLAEAPRRDKHRLVQIVSTTPDVLAFAPLGALQH